MDLGQDTRPRFFLFDKLSIIKMEVGTKMSEKKGQVIRTEVIRTAKEYEDECRRLSALFSETRETNYLQLMYTPLVELCTIVYNVSQIYTTQARWYIVHEMASYIIKRFETTEEYQIFSWYKYIRISFRRIRDDYILNHSSQVYTPCITDDKVSYWSTSEEAESIVEDTTDQNSGIIWDKISYEELLDMYEESVRVELPRYNRLKPKTSRYYRSLLSSMSSPDESVHQRILARTMMDKVKDYYKRRYD